MERDRGLLLSMALEATSQDEELSMGDKLLVRIHVDQLIERVGINVLSHSDWDFILSSLLTNLEEYGFKMPYLANFTNTRLEEMLWIYQVDRKARLVGRRVLRGGIFPERQYREIKERGDREMMEKINSLTTKG